ncbi:MAG TPA: hypothetical protein VJR71_10895 [Pseudolabrys sp.]|nr:hypothetical protein [Pseudolabrys sp.]
MQAVDPGRQQREEWPGGALTQMLVSAAYDDKRETPRRWVPM